jgi:hypothetical protein
MGTKIITLTGLPGMPHMIEELFLMPYFPFARIDQSKGHLIRAADMAEIINMFIRSTDIYKIFSKGSHTGTVISSMKRIYLVKESGRLTILPVDTTLPQYLFHRWVIERIESAIVIPEFIQMQNNISIFPKGLDDRFHKARLEHGIRIA